MRAVNGQQAALARRSQLFVPANAKQFVESALQTEADAFILDLEDSVPPSELGEARGHLNETINELATSGQPVFVRVNSKFELLTSDLDAAVNHSLRGIVVPKVQNARDMHIVEALLRDRELRMGLEPGSLEVQILVESCVGLLNLPEIAAASERAISMTIGLEDLASDLEVEQAEASSLSWAHGQMLFTARAAGIAPYGLLGSLTNFTDMETFADNVRASRSFGYVGAFCIHPRQVPIVNAGFSPSASEVMEAREIIERLEAAERNGVGATAIRGQMIDAPVVARARHILRRFEAQQQKGSAESPEGTTRSAL